MGQVVIGGNVAAQPELRYTPTGIAVANSRLRSIVPSETAPAPTRTG